MARPPFRPRPLAAAAAAALLLAAGPAVPEDEGPPPVPGAAARLVAWNDLGMHCMDADFSVFSILPPFNTIHAQLVRDGALVADPAGIEVTYEAVADPSGSFNATSVGKTGFWDFAGALYGATPPADVGLAGFAMPGPGNAPRAMRFDAPAGWWSAEGIPVTPVDDAGLRNPYPMMRIVAREGTAAIAEARIVLPVSDEMDCRACHASGSPPGARPPSGWVGDPDPQRDYRRNVLRLHDAREGWRASFDAALAARGYAAAGLEATAAGGTPVLCAGCHASNALPGTGLAGIPALTAAVHGLHARVADPVVGIALGDSANRAACYRCHPGSETRCLRGAMGSAVSPDGTRSMHCQACHGPMAAVGDPARTGWLDQPACQSCHTGTAVRNAGEIRYRSALDAAGARRAAPDATFATEADVPSGGFSLYRFSRGHGGLACEACHGSPHAEFATSHASDNLASLDAQGHVGPLADCEACHRTVPSTVAGGPHGLHPVGARGWVEGHADAVEAGGAASCRACHGVDYRGTELSRALGDRAFSTELGPRALWRGFQVGCYCCHDGPGSDDPARNRAPEASGDTVAAVRDVPLAIPLLATDPDGDALSLRVVGQPVHGAVGLSGSAATWFPDPGFEGTDSFTFAAWDGRTQSGLARVDLVVSADPGPGPGPAPAADLAASSEPPVFRYVAGKDRYQVKWRVSVANQGALAAPATRLRVLLSADGTADASDVPLREWKVPALAPGRTAVRKVKVKVPAAAGFDRMVLAVANPDGAFPEMTRGNNAASMGPLR